jgi:uncharacterized membrane protein
VKKFSTLVVIAAAAVLLFPYQAAAQLSSSAAAAARAATARADAAPQNVPPQARQAEADVERTVRRFRVGVEGGVSLDPELLNLGAHAAFGPIFHPGIEFRPGIEVGLGELTTLFGINLDVLYSLPGATGDTRWVPYIGAGPNFALSHRGFDTDDEDVDDERSRFDFGDTDFNGGFNFIAGARNQGGLFIEMKATAYGVSNIRLLVGYNF